MTENTLLSVNGKLRSTQWWLEKKNKNTNIYFLAPRHGGWGSWQPASWAETQCSNGYKTRYRNCDNPCPAHGGRDCSGSKSKRIDCNECNVGNGGCDHTCINYVGYHRCTCYPGYELYSGKRCRRK